MQNNTATTNAPLLPATPAKYGELDIQISTARAYPRTVANSITEATQMATSTKEIAEQCNYTLERKDNKTGQIKHILGPSVRLAEILMQTWGNFYTATRILGDDGKVVTAQAVAWDLEKNVRIQTEVQRSILTRAGRQYSSDMKAVTANAAASIALRNAAFRAIPKAYVDQVYQIAMSFAKAGNKIEEGIEKAFKYFASINYDEKHVLAYLGKESKADLTKDDLLILGGVKNRIDDGSLNPEDALSLNGESSTNEEDTADLDTVMES
jgi:hypothetical protein